MPKAYEQQQQTNDKWIVEIHAWDAHCNDINLPGVVIVGEGTANGEPGIKVDTQQLFPFDITRTLPWSGTFLIVGDDPDGQYEFSVEAIANISRAQYRELEVASIFCVLKLNGKPVSALDQRGVGFNMKPVQQNGNYSARCSGHS